MRKSIAVALAVLMAGAVLTTKSEPAEARRWGGALAAGLIGGIAIGAILASRHHRRHHAYYGHRPYYSYGYRPVYYASYAPRRYHRHHYHHHHRRW